MLDLLVDCCIAVEYQDDISNLFEETTEKKLPGTKAKRHKGHKIQSIWIDSHYSCGLVAVRSWN
jgi:hypothetical protein